ncbi:hypothetical protein [Pandoraea terrae]|uniref:hypothetical protein n=1 Tax=Pandoraea terrae TaxID=1537710 RepID=UPI00124085FD|nr:hypothetical protein [Pandoraea terrae]
MTSRRNGSRKQTAAQRRVPAHEAYHDGTAAWHRDDAGCRARSGKWKMAARRRAVLPDGADGGTNGQREALHIRSHPVQRFAHLRGITEKAQGRKEYLLRRCKMMRREKSGSVDFIAWRLSHSKSRRTV